MRMGNSVRCPVFCCRSRLFSLTSILLGAEMSFFEIERIIHIFVSVLISSRILRGTSSLTLSMLIPVGIGLCMIQFVTSMITSRLTSYLISTAFLLASAYMQNVLLFPERQYVCKKH